MSIQKLLILLLLCGSMDRAHGQLYFGGSIGYTVEIPGLMSRLSPSHGLITSAEIRKITGKLGFSLDFNQMRYNQYIYGTNFKAIKTITIPCKINFDYHFLTDKKLSPYIGTGVGLAHTKTLEAVFNNGNASTNEFSGASNCYNIRSGLLFDTKLGKLIFNFNYLYLPNQLFNAAKTKYDKRYAHILNLGIGMLFEI